MTTLETLLLFVSKDMMRPAIMAPLRRGDYLYATDGAIAVRMHDDPAVITDPANDLAAPNVGRLMAQYDFDPAQFGPLKFDPLKSSTPCVTCGGTGQVATCENCEGEGEIYDDDDNSYTCKSCGGDGFKNGIGEVCIRCKGSGKKAQPVAIGPAKFNLRYLEILEQLPGIRFAPGSATGVARFLFDGGIGLLMPMRDGS